MRLAREGKALARWILLADAFLVCLFLLGCGSSSTPTPPPPPAPLGHAYVVTGNTTYGYSITAATGALQSVNVSAGLPGVGKYITSNGTYVYVLVDNGLITAYKINSDFTLGEIAGSPFSGAPNGVAFVAVDPAGKYLFVPAPLNSVVEPYTIIAATGALTAGNLAATPAGSLTVTVDPQDRFVYVPMDSGGTELFQLNGGALIDVETIPPLASGKSEFVAITPNGQFAYIADGVSGIAAYSVNSSTGQLTPIASTPFTAGPGTSTLAITPNGKFLYAATTAGLTSFTINSDGTLSANGPVLPLSSPAVVLSIEPTGAYMYATTVGASQISVFGIQSSGLLTQLPVVVTPSVPSGIVTTY